jgi:hypothetical protein
MAYSPYCYIKRGFAQGIFFAHASTCFFTCLQELAAAQQHRSTLLRRSLAAWRQYTALRALKAAARQRAEQHKTTRLAAAALSGFAARVEYGRIKRQRLFAAAMHRRMWLLRRAFMAWR